MHETIADVVCDGNVHAMPVDDHVMHVESALCICGPSLEVIPADPINGIVEPVLFYKHIGLDGNSWDLLPD